MIRYDAGTTNPAFLEPSGYSAGDQPAWVDFVTRYDPVIRLSCRRYRLDADTTEELCQLVWIDPGAANAARSATTQGRRFAVGSAGCANRGRSTCCGRRRPTPCSRWRTSRPSRSRRTPLMISTPRKAPRRHARCCSNWRRRFRTPFGDGSTNGRGRFSGRSPSSGSPPGRGFRSRGHLLLRRVRRPEACRPDAPRGGATAHGPMAG